VKLDAEAVQVMAECISRSEHLTIDIDVSKSEGVVVCERCSSPTALIIPVRGISDVAVYNLGTVTACALCDGQGEP
jgi:hypothetical protein